VGDFAVKFFGLGGSSSIRGYWDNYFDEVLETQNTHKRHTMNTQ
jgi:hypothetical protein